MKNNLFSVVIAVLVSTISLSAQDHTSAIEQREAEFAKLEAQQEALTLEIDSFNLLRDLDRIKAIGLPSDNYLDYLGYYLEYSEQHEQALWTMHIINPRIQTRGVGRTNDFRMDERITTKTAEEIDYFTYDAATDTYDGYGYDRGHLVPSADFRFSTKAMSDTYYYSNISPQLNEFNADIWADIEDFGRAFVYKHNRPLAVVTIPIFDNNEKIARSINGVTIPTRFAKAFLDIETNEAVGFILNHASSDAKISKFMVTIDQIESVSGFDLFSKSKIDKGQLNSEFWFDVIENPITPIPQNTLKKGYYNTESAPELVGINKEVWVCGKCVGGTITRNGHLFLNIDKKYPNAPISGFVKKENLGHFEASPLDYYKDKDICIKGNVEKWDRDSTPTISLKNSHYIKLYQQ